VTDAILVRAPVGLVYRALTDVVGWSDWWPGCRAVRVGSEVAAGAVDGAGSATHDTYRLELKVARRRLRTSMDVHGWRHDLGMFVDVSGAVDLRTEWWLETRPEGAIVHHVVHRSSEAVPPARRSRRSRSAERRYLGSVAAAMQSLKDRLELTTSVALGRVP